MSLRREAPTAAAEWTLAVETLAREQDRLVATVGQLTLEPGASNVIPGRVQLSLDLRHAEDTVRIRAGAELRRHAELIAASRGVGAEWTSHETAAVSLSPELIEHLAEAVAASGRPVVRLPSAGHDAAIVSRITPAAMLFVRCAGGVSHNPAESVTVEDVAAAIEATTAAIDMPLNAHPPTVSGAAFDEKRRCLERSVLVDMALWGGLIPGGVEAMDELAARGVVGFKAFMCSSGIDDFPGVDDLTLYEGMCRAASLGLPVAVHAESEAMTAGLAQRARAAGRTATRDFVASRPAVAELQAIARAIALAQESGCLRPLGEMTLWQGAQDIVFARE